MNAFQYHPQIIHDYPNIVGGVIVAHGISSDSDPAALQAAYQAEQEATKTRLKDTPLSEVPSLAAWRAAFRQFGADPTKYRSAAEALLRRLTKKGDIPSINMLVDMGNLVSIRYALPVAVFDTQHLQLPITVHVADGTERYTGLGETDVTHPDVGEVVFSDLTKLVVARRWCFRQSAESAAGGHTENAVITIEAHHEGGRTDVEKALSDMLTLLGEHTNCILTHAILDGQQWVI